MNLNLDMTQQKLFIISIKLSENVRHVNKSYITGLKTLHQKTSTLKIIDESGV